MMNYLVPVENTPLDFAASREKRFFPIIIEYVSVLSFFGQHPIRGT